ncbi:MAG: peptidase S16 [Alphaproteobacteria bacterium]|jgi:Lon protease-like protein|nr:peptidase S16 [Alphaproteobacteria bacterium]
MTPGPRVPTFEELGPTLPVFPLSGVLLLPRGQLPLNIFEPRYLAMVDDALAGDRLIGMIQPSDGADGRAKMPPLYGTGCAGRITALEETDDGRYLITLTGVARFRVDDELATTRGYRRCAVDFGPFRDDLEAPEAEGEGAISMLDRDRLGRALDPYFRQQGIKANWDAIAETPDERLITSLAMICPFGPSEKQALLEAPGLADRAEMMISLLEMAVLQAPGSGENDARH